MRRFCVILICILAFSSVIAQAQASVEFIENRGQWGSWFQYMAKTTGGEVFLENDGFRYILCAEQNRMRIDSFHVGLLKTPPLMRFHVYTVKFEGCSQPRLEGLKPQKTYYNYFLGDDSSKWKSGIHPDLAIDYKGLYRGIDMHVSSEKGELVYEFIVQPDANVNQVKLKFDGPDKMNLSKGNLVIQTSVGQVMELKPIAYQYINDERKVIECDYKLKNNNITFDFPNGYDHSKQLIVDPTVVFCSFTGSTADNWGFTATYDALGNAYTGGLVNALAIVGGGAYPVTTGAYQSTFAGGQGNSGIEYGADVGIMKFNPSGTTRIYATYLGGANNERPHSMIVDTSGNLIVVGRTKSTNFPVTAGCFQSANAGGWDYFVTKFNSTATALLGSTYLGGSLDDGVNYDSTELFYGHLKFNYGDDARSEIKIDNAENIYVTGCTWSTNFPTTAATAYSSTFLGGMQDGVIFKMDPTLTTMIWSTYIGGSGDDAGYVLTFNNEQSALYVAGGTNSTNFPVTSGAWQSTYGGDSADGYILKFQNSPPYTLLKGTFVGTSHYDQVYGIQVDNEDQVYVMGQSLGGAFPIAGAGVYSNANSSQFVMKIDSNLSTDMISTVYGSGDPLHTNISPVAFLIDTCENVYISGWGGNLTLASTHEGTCTSMPITSDAYQPTTDGYDFYFIVFGPGITTLRYATYYGRYDPIIWEGEHVDGGTSRFDKHGIIYQAICANCGGPTSTPFPTTAGSYATVDASSNCNEAVLKIAFNIGPVTIHISASPSTSGCAPLTVNFINSSTNVISYLWDFGDGTTGTAFAPTHVFNTPGVYTVTISGSNSSACFRTDDTQKLVIYVDTGLIHPAFIPLFIDSCGPFIASITNTSTQTIAADSTHTIYNWFFSDGTAYTGKYPPDHTFPGAGTYTVTMIMTDSTSCNSPDSTNQVITFYGPLSLNVNASSSTQGCAPLTVDFSNTSTNVVTYSWNFGDGSTSTIFAPTHTYNTAGIYTVTIVGANPDACNKKTDTQTIMIVVDTNQVYPSFTFTYVDTCGPFIVSLTNTSTQGVSSDSSLTTYKWFFSDGTTYSGKTPPNHIFPSLATYTITLVMTDTAACISPVTVNKVISFSNFFVSSSFTLPDSVCLGISVTPDFKVTDATSQKWYFGNGDSAFAPPTPSYTYAAVGTYTVTFIASNPGSCNGADTVKYKIKIMQVPTANFTFSPVTPVANEPTTYTNLSTNADRYLWDFGDNSSSTDVNPVHQFNNTGFFKTCLTAYNNSNCPSRICKQVSADVTPVVGIPSAFSPNGDGSNDILYVRGAAISTIDLKIWNRWGQMVFETKNLEQGWDGTFNGQPQPIDAYAYVLIVTFIDGTGKTLKGNITLLR